MRVRFGNHVDLCKRVSWSEGCLLTVTTIYDNEYVVDCKTKEQARRMYEQVLKVGYIDVSHLPYSNLVVGN